MTPKMCDIVKVATGRIVIVEDDERIAMNLQRALIAEGYVAERAATIALAHTLLEHDADLVLLDIGLPDGDGVELCRELSVARPGLPVVLLTARGEEIDIVVGLDAGAVDYITKPFRLAELLARIRARLRESPLDDGLGASGAGTRLQAGDVAVDRGSRRAWLVDEEIELRAKEFDLLAELVENAGLVVTREDLMSRVWDEHWFGSTKTLDVHIRALRRRLGEDSPEGSRIVALRSVGYRFEPRL